MNRGLIEAHSNGLFEVALRVLPRFMNRGLIEAGRGRPRLDREGRTSPIHESGPH